jgi:hypothetical protein
MVPGVHVRDETEPDGECKLGTDSPGELDRDRGIMAPSAVRMSDDAFS